MVAAARHVEEALVTMDAPGIIDPRSHYAREGGSSGMSDMERKMRLMMEAEAHGHDDNASDHEHGGANDEPLNHSMAANGNASNGQSSSRAGPSKLDALPIELVERILAHATAPSDDLVSQVAGTNASMRKAIALHNATRLCLVCKQFDALVRPMMYSQVCVVHRKTRAFLRTIESSERLASYVRELTLNSRIWTSDVSEDTIARILVAVRRHIRRLYVGANESTLLPYLFYGDPERQNVQLEPTSLRALHICWRDEIDFTPHQRRYQRRQARLRHVTEDARANGAAPEPEGNGLGGYIDGDDTTDYDTEDDDAVRDTLRGLFEHAHQAKQQGCDNAPLALSNLQHLTLDLFTHAQLAQLFLSGGYFVEQVLPQLQLLRVELPLAVLQFAAPAKGAIARQWPCKRYRLHSRNIEAMLSDRIEQNRSVTVDYAVQQQQQQEQARASSRDGLALPSDNSEQEQDVQSQCNDNVVLAPCADHQLKALLMRYALNVHKNDLTLFEVLLAPTRALEAGSWSSRAAIAAYCLKATFEKRLAGSLEELQANGHRDASSIGASTQISPFVVFPLAKFQAQGVPNFWRAQWDEADYVFAEQLQRAALHYGGLPYLQSSSKTPYNDVHLTNRLQSHGAHAAILLKWPTAQEAFFHHSAMV